MSDAPVVRLRLGDIPLPARDAAKLAPKSDWSFRAGITADSKKHELANWSKTIAALRRTDPTRESWLIVKIPLFSKANHLRAIFVEPGPRKETDNAKPQP